MHTILFVLFLVAAYLGYVTCRLADFAREQRESLQGVTGIRPVSTGRYVLPRCMAESRGDSICSLASARGR